MPTQDYYCCRPPSNVPGSKAFKAIYLPLFFTISKYFFQGTFSPTPQKLTAALHGSSSILAILCGPRGQTFTWLDHQPSWGRGSVPTQLSLAYIQAVFPCLVLNYKIIEALMVSTHSFLKHLRTLGQLQNLKLFLGCVSLFPSPQSHN